jgi:transposase-like protein
MVNNPVGVDLGLPLRRHPRALPSQEWTERVQGVWWLNRPNAVRTRAAPATHTWTCPRCGSHRYIRTNPGNTRQASYCCVICGYRFRAAAETRLLIACTSRDR